jgi:hypothetical protein
MLHNLSGADEIDLKMVRGLNLNLEGQALPAGTQCVGTLVTGSYATKKVASPPSAAFMASSTPRIPSFDELCIKTEEIFGKKPCFFQCRLGTAQLQRCNIISIAATGSGKTLSYLITLPFSDGKIIIIVSALNVLGDQFVAETMAAGYPAISVTAAYSALRFSRDRSLDRR